MDAQTRRRARRQARQAAWKADNPLLVGVNAKPGKPSQLISKHRQRGRIYKALQIVNEYGLQIIQNAQLYQEIRQHQNSIIYQRHHQRPDNHSGLPDAQAKPTRYNKYFSRF